MYKGRFSPIGWITFNSPDERSLIRVKAGEIIAVVNNDIILSSGTKYTIKEDIEQIYNSIMMALEEEKTEAKKNV